LRTAGSRGRKAGKVLASMGENTIFYPIGFVILAQRQAFGQSWYKLDVSVTEVARREYKNVIRDII